LVLGQQKSQTRRLKKGSVCKVVQTREQKTPAEQTICFVGRKYSRYNESINYMQFLRSNVVVLGFGLLLFVLVLFIFSSELSPVSAQNPLSSLAQPSSELSVSSLSKYYGVAGTLVTLSGSGFSLTENTVNFGKTKIRNVSAKSATEISFAVPKNSKPGRYDVSVSNGLKTSLPVPFMVTKVGAQVPVVEKVEPAQATFGQQIKITGKNFTARDNIFSSNLGVFDRLESKDGKTITFTIPTPDYLIKDNTQLREVWFGEKDNLHWPVWFRIANTNGVTVESPAAKFIINIQK